MQTRSIASSADNPEVLLTEREAAEFLSVSSFTLARLRKMGQLPFHVIGSQIRYLPRDVIVYRDGARRQITNPPGAP